MKKLLLSLTFLGVFLPLFVSANNVADLQAQIADLLAQIKQLQAQIASQTGSTSWCFNFNTDISIGDSGSEVGALQTALEKEGLQIKGGWNTNSFDEFTASAVSAFQEKYRSEILTPAGLFSPTGYVGGRTRTKLNQLYGCGQKPSPLPVNPIMPVACTMEAKLCPDGKTYVSRIAPSCQFSACPVSTTPATPVSSVFSAFWASPGLIESGKTVSIGYSGTNVAYVKVTVNCPVAVTSIGKDGDYCDGTSIIQLEPSYPTGNFQFINDSLTNQKITFIAQAYDSSNSLIGTKHAYVDVSPSGALPSITSTSAKAAGNFEMYAGGEATINGDNLFSFCCKYDTRVFIGGMEVSVSSVISKNAITINVPAFLIVGRTYDMYVTTYKGTSNVVKVKILSNSTSQVLPP